MKIIVVICLAVAVVASLNWATSALGYDIVGKVLKLDEKRVGAGLTAFQKVVYIAIAAAGIVGASMGFAMVVMKK